MRESERRSRFQIYYEILKGIQEQIARRGVVTPTPISQRVGVPYDRLKEYLGKLDALGMIEASEQVTITEKGCRFLSEYPKVFNFLVEMGLVKLEEEL